MPGWTVDRTERALVVTAGRGRYPQILDLLLLERPSCGFAYLRRAGALRLLPELEALVGLEQDPRWHPEGDAWIHTLLVVDEAARLRAGLSGRDQELLMVAALCHDLGKPRTTERHGQRVRSLGHEAAGEEPTRALLHRLDAPPWVAAPVCELVRRHLAPVSFVKCGARERAYRRLEARLQQAGASVPLLLRLCRADQWGRTGPDALSRRFDEGVLFEARWREARAGRSDGRVVSTNAPDRSRGRPR